MSKPRGPVVTNGLQEHYRENTGLRETDGDLAEASSACPERERRMTITGHGRTGARLAIAAFAATLALLAAGVGSASAAPAATAKATNTCWLDVVNDWLDHSGVIHGTYPIPCYTQAIQHLDAYPDIKEYSTASDDIHRARLAALRQDRGGGPGNGGLAGGTNPDGTNVGPGGGKSSGGGGFFNDLAGKLGPGNARSIPLPLLVLGGLALLLLLAAIATWLAKRIQTRRMTPAPAPAPLSHERR